MKQSVQVVTTTTGGGAGSVILPPVMGTSTFAGPPAKAAVSNVALIVVGALVNALFGTNGAVPFVVPTNINVVSGDPFPLRKTSNPLPLTNEICDATTLNKPLVWPGVVVEMLPLNSLTLTAPRGVSSVVFTINEIGPASTALNPLTLRPIVVPVIGTVTVWLKLGDAASSIVDALRQTDKATSFFMIFRFARNVKNKDLRTKT